MTAEIIQAEYEILEAIAKRFVVLAETANGMQSNLYTVADALYAGGWEGAGFDSFSREMDDVVNPALERLFTSQEEASHIVAEIIQILQNAEEDGKSQFLVEGQRSNDELEEWADRVKAIAEKIRPPFISLHKETDLENFYQTPINQDGENFPALPLYKLDMDNLYDQDLEKFVDELDTGGRPVVFAVHGFSVGDDKAEDSYLRMVENYEEQYAEIPEHQRPVIIGVDWNAKDKIPVNFVLNPFKPIPFVDFENDYAIANANAEKTGDKLGELIKLYNEKHPDSDVNIVAHSLGTKVTAEALSSSDVKVNRVLLVQSVLDRDDVLVNGKYDDLLSLQKVEYLGITQTNQDDALEIHQLTQGENPIGLEAEDTLEVISSRKNAERFSMTPHNEEDTWNPTENHYGLDHETIHNEATVEFFGEDGSGFTKDSPIDHIEFNQLSPMV